MAWKDVQWNLSSQNKDPGQAVVR